ncbi:AraC family transcriptional regulator [Clostridium sp. Marseille-P2415]|uniref:AraC family transcriptional regulator n=1 Tax=Clostridium sp. Marseille-P2415 TaxID=1805471 RepID=UPI000988441A|nr:AraC family transcriptional regulator [Clostridium sp. Marseille-P2415]
MKNSNWYVHSVNPLQDTGFPFLTLKIENTECFPPNFGFKKMHWHEDIQFIFILKGKARFQTTGSSMDLNEGEAVFINKGVLHKTEPQMGCHYRSFIFPESFLTFYPGSFMAKNNVLPITNNAALPMIVFKPSKQWQKQIISLLSQLDQLAEKRENVEFYEYTVLVKLVSIWLKIIANIKVPCTDLPKSDFSRQERMRSFLSFLEHNFDRSLSLEDIAGSAHVSKTECIRCFKSILQTTPYEYLMKLRLTKSIELLKNTDDTVTQIAYMTGFNSTSHYIKYFKEEMKMTPLKYRKA